MAFPVRRLELSETPALAAFAEACFREAFLPHFGAGALEVLCPLVFATNVMEQLIRNGAWVAGDWQGYVALGTTPCPVPELPSPVVELARLYVPLPWQGQGVANALMETSLAEARQRGGRSAWLQAYAGNPRALAFYRRWGFRDFGPFTVACQGLELPHRALGRDL